MQRRHDLDWVRVLAFCLLVAYHVGMYYVSWEWHVNTARPSHALEPFMVLSAPWRLGLLFLVSGAATAFLLGKGEHGFLRRRSWRLLLPLLVGMLVVVPPQSYCEVLEKLPGGYSEGYLAFWLRYLRADPGFCRDGECLVLPTWNHLWFVAYLWFYTFVLWLGLRLAPKASARILEAIRQALRGRGLLVWPVLFLALARLGLFPLFDSTHALVDDWYNHVQYMALFVAGFAIARADAAWDAIEASRHVASAIALACGVFIGAYFHIHADGAPPPTALLWTQRLIWAVMQWSVIVAMLGHARHWSPVDSPLLRYLSAAVFPVYILHQTIIVVLAHHLKPLALAPVLEGPLLVVATFALSFAGVELIRRTPFLRPLFGMAGRRAGAAGHIARDPA